MPYRHDDEALLERLSALHDADDALRQRERELASLGSERARLQSELADVQKRLGREARRALPLLDRLEVASPCSASWDKMVGDDVTRFCGECEKDVHNLSAMTRAEAEAFLRERAGEEVCVRFYRRSDGTVLSSDCAVGARRRRRRRAALVVAGAGALSAAAAVLYVPVEGKGPFGVGTSGMVQGAVVAEVGTVSTGGQGGAPPQGEEHDDATAAPPARESHVAEPRGTVMGRLRAYPRPSPSGRGADGPGAPVLRRSR